MTKQRFLKEAKTYGYNQAAALDAIEFTELILSQHLEGLKTGPTPRYSHLRAILLGKKGVVRLQTDLEEILRG